VRSELPPCLLCGGKVEYLWDESANLLDAAYVTISPGYGSKHDLAEFTAILCDECITAAAKKAAVHLSWSAEN
jgi:hypothetical protein